MVSPQGGHVSWEKCIMALCHCCIKLWPPIFKHEYLPGGIQNDLPHHSQGSFEPSGFSGGTW
jgi:hypothetical protein